MIEANFLIPQNADMCVREKRRDRQKRWHTQADVCIHCICRKEAFYSFKKWENAKLFFEGDSIEKHVFREERVLHCHDGQTLFTPNQPQSDIVPHWSNSPLSDDLKRSFYKYFVCKALFVRGVDEFAWSFCAKKIGIFKIEKADDASQTIFFFCLVTIFSERETLKMEFWKKCEIHTEGKCFA